MKNKATPRPWRIREDSIGWPSVVNFSGTMILGNVVGYSTGEARDNANLIVRAVNSYDAHQALVKAAQLAKDQLVVLASLGKYAIHGDALQRLTEALAAVEAAEKP